MDKETKQLIGILRRHHLWLEGEKGGEQIEFIHRDLAFKDLSYHNFKKANFEDSNFWGADLRYANFSQADFSRTYLVSANFEGANLKGANLEEANLNSVIGNMREIKSAQIEGFSIVYTVDVLWIGREGHTFEKWLNFTDEEITKIGATGYIGGDLLAFWKKWKDWIFKTIEMSPAL